MKELSIEEKAKAYDEALKYAMIYYKNSNENMKMMMKTCFPVLAEESEDERIRKEIIHLVKKSNEYGGYALHKDEADEMLAWLEKQGKNNMGISEATKQELEDNLNKALEKETPESWNEFLDEQGEQKSQRTISAEAKEALFDYENANIKQKDFAPNDEQKPADTVEPKFHEGEWITNGDYTWKVVEVKPLDYILQSQDGNIVDDTISHVDEQFHFFTPEDAKDGDVLVVNDNTQYQWIGIFKEHTGCTFTSYCHYNTGMDEFITNKARCRNHGTGKYSNIHPATKEQCDLLFQKMRDAGYEWDAEKKTLKKVELKSTWSEEDEGFLNLLLAVFTNQHPNGIFSTGDIPVFKGNPVTSNRIIKWLKSLRPQSHWKPSDEQIEALEHFVRSIGESGYASPYDNNTKLLYSLLEQLKKLKG